MLHFAYEGKSPLQGCLKKKKCKQATLQSNLFTTTTERERERQREKQAPFRKPDAGFDPRTPGSHPGPKAGSKLLSHPGIPYY